MRWMWLLGVCGWIGAATLAADVPASGPATRAAVAVPVVAPVEPTTVPSGEGFSVTDVAAQADAAINTIDDLTAKFTADPITANVDEALPAELGLIVGPATDATRQLSAAPSIETLKSLQVTWTEYNRTLEGWSRDLKRRGERLGDIEQLLANYRDIKDAAGNDTGQWVLDGGLLFDWQHKLALANERHARPQVVERIKVIVSRITDLKNRVEWEIHHLRDLQDGLSEPLVVVRGVLSDVKTALDKALDHLLVRDSPPLWDALLHPNSQGDLSEISRNSFSAQRQALVSYLMQNRSVVLLHTAGILTLAALLIWLRRQTRVWAANDPSLAAATRVFQTPIATAVVATVMMMPWIYPGAPRLFWALFGSAALLPTLLVLRPLIERSLMPLMYALLAVCGMNLLIDVAAALPLVSRLLFLLEMGGTALFFVWFQRSRRGVAGDPSRPPLRRTVVVGVRLGLVLTFVAFCANVFGFVTLSKLIASAMLTSAYLGVLLDTTVHVADALLLGASHLRPLTSLGMIQRHRPLLLRRLHFLLIVFAVLLWGYFVLESLSVRRPVVQTARRVWYFPSTPEIAADNAARAATQPSFESSGMFSVGGVVLFGVTLAASLYVSRFIAFLLDEDVYPRLHLARGMPYAISTLLRYVLLSIGFSIAIVQLGYGDPTKLTILVSAFGVGLGFGMQNIVNNFVSGLILLFERPVQVGDVIELDNFTGVVSRIGIRASIIRTPLAAEIIVPNGRLISDRVINWTLSNRQRGVEIPLTVSGQSDPQRLIQLLAATAKSHPLVAAYPSPQAFFTEFSGGGMKFEVRAWTNRFEDWAQVRSELSVAINAMLLKEEIALK